MKQHCLGRLLAGDNYVKPVNGWQLTGMCNGRLASGLGGTDRLCWQVDKQH